MDIKQKGFIQIPILIAIIVVVVIIGGGGYIVVKKISRRSSPAINNDAQTETLGNRSSNIDAEVETQQTKEEIGEFVPQLEPEVAKQVGEDKNDASVDIPKEESPPSTPEELSKRYATIIELVDSKGNVNFQSEHNEKDPTWLQPWPKLKVGETITISVDVANQIANPISYQFVGTGFPNVWQGENSVTVTIDESVFNIETIHLRVFVKNVDDQHRAPHYDDMIQVFYNKASYF